MILSDERELSYCNAAQTQYNRPDIRVAMPADQPDTVAGMMNLGWKYCFIHGQPDVLRYGSDLRLNKDHRGQKILRLLMDYLDDALPKDRSLESIILEGHAVARQILHEKRKGFPVPYHYDELQTFMVSQALKPRAYGLFCFERLGADTLAEANAFIQLMKSYYNFLPHYDLVNLADVQHSFWAGSTA
ncbi:hypothetical protein [Acinetobacter sp.]|uniref:hypothetical protein n=1 Tax=Acinetobacter sp. TaxID=472 RepID=UPI0035AE03FF